MDLWQQFRGLDWFSNSSNRDDGLIKDGYYIIDSFCDIDQCKLLSGEILREFSLQMAAYRVRETEAEYGQVRSPFIGSEILRSFIFRDDFIEECDRHLVGNSILHLCNGQVVMPDSNHNQSKWHRDLNKCHISKPPLSVNILLFFGQYGTESCQTPLPQEFDVIAGSHQLYGVPDFGNSTRLSLMPGSALVFDSLLWHRVCQSDKVQIFLNSMFTEPFIKQQIDKLGTTQQWVNGLDGQNELAERVLGYWSSPPTSIDEFRKAEHSSFHISK